MSNINNYTDFIVVVVFVQCRETKLFSATKNTNAMMTALLPPLHTHTYSFIYFRKKYLSFHK